MDTKRSTLSRSTWHCWGDEKMLVVDPQVMGIFSWDPPQIIIESSHQSISIPSSPGYLRGSTWWLSPDRIFGDESSHHHPISSPAPPPFGFHWESVCSKGAHLEETRKRSYLRIHTFSHGAKKIKNHNFSKVKTSIKRPCSITVGLPEDSLRV